MSSSTNGLATNGKNGKKRRRRIIWGSIALVVLLGAGFGVKAALSPNHEIDPSKLANVEKGDLARVVVATGKRLPDGGMHFIQPDPEPWSQMFKRACCAHGWVYWAQCVKATK